MRFSNNFTSVYIGCFTTAYKIDFIGELKLYTTIQTIYLFFSSEEEEINLEKNLYYSWSL